LKTTAERGCYVTFLTRLGRRPAEVVVTRQQCWNQTDYQEGDAGSRDKLVVLPLNLILNSICLSFQIHQADAAGCSKAGIKRGDWIHRGHRLTGTRLRLEGKTDGIHRTHKAGWSRQTQTCNKHIDVYIYIYIYIYNFICFNSLW